MRLAPLALAAAVVAGAIAPASAQDSAGTRIIIRKPPPKSYLDPGTVVKPGTKSYLDYVGVVEKRFPSYGTDSSITGTRWPLPGRFDLPGY